MSMYVALLFWLALAIPGYVLLRRFTPDDLQSGLLGTLGLSYLAIMGALSPVSILCYLLGAPLWVFSAACLLAVLLALFELTRQRWWGQLGRLLLAGLCLEMLFVLIDVGMGARIGTFMTGDARLHLTRIRFLVDNGFSNLDPFVAVPYFFPTYHTNLFHALSAACVQITGQDHFAVWFVSLAWAKILVAAGSYWLAWCIFQKSWPAWASAIFMIAIEGPVTFVLYPNKLCPFWAIPYVVGFAIQALQGPIAWRSCIKLAIGTLILGQLHGLYALFAVLLLGPVLTVAVLHKFIRRRADRWMAATCLLAIFAGLPFPVISKLKTAAPQSAAADAPTVSKSDFDKLTRQPTILDTTAGQFIELSNGWVMKNPRRGFGAGYWKYALLLAGAAVALATPRRKQVACMLAVTGVAIVVLFVPPVCTLLVKTLGAQWILGRFEFVLRMALMALVPSVAVFWLDRISGYWWSRGPISLLIVVLAANYFGHGSSYSWSNYRKIAFAPATHRLKELTQYRSHRQFIQDNLPAGETILSDPNTGMWFVAFYDCYIVAAESSSNGVTDLLQRRRDLMTMLQPRTPWPDRYDLLRKYHIRYFLPGPSPFQWARPHIRSVSTGKNFALFLLDTQ